MHRIIIFIILSLIGMISGCDCGSEKRDLPIACMKWNGIEFEKGDNRSTNNLLKQDNVDSALWLLQNADNLGRFCPWPDFQIASICDIGPLANSEKIWSRDGGYSAVFKGKSVWTFGDTFLTETASIAPNVPVPDMLRSGTAAWLSLDTDLAKGPVLKDIVDKDGKVAQLIPYLPDEIIKRAAGSPDGYGISIWPGLFVTNPKTGNAWVFYIKLKTKGLDFYGIGSSIAVWKDLNKSPERLLLPGRVVRQSDPTLLFFEDQDPTFASAGVVEGDYLYVMAGGGAAKGTLIARAPVTYVDEDVMDRRAWKYYNSEKDIWVDEWKDATFANFPSGVSSMAFNPFLGRYVAMGVVAFGSKLEMSIAPHPWGPWSTPCVIANAYANPLTDGIPAYMGNMHPELSPDGGKTTYVTYHSTAPGMNGVNRVVQIQFVGIADALKGLQK